MTRHAWRWWVGLACFAAWASPLGAQGPATATEPVLPRTIPLFPLEEAMLFPKVSRPLVIFEPRYRTMVADALKGDRIIGMAMLEPGHESEYEGRPPIRAVGCAGRIAEARELPDGRYTIVLEGFVKFRVTNEDQSRAYRLGHVEAVPEAIDGTQREALRQLRPSIEMLFSFVSPASEPPPAGMDDEVLVNTLAQYMDFTPLERQSLLEQPGAVARAKALIGLLEQKPPPPR